MTLEQYVDLACTKLHRTDLPSRQEARKYVRSRYQMIYEGCPWRDVIEAMVVPFPLQQVVILPHIIDRIMGIRWGDSIMLRNVSLWETMQMNPAKFEEIGDPLSYSIISPSGVQVDPLGSMLNLATGAATQPYQVSITGSYQGALKYEQVTVSGGTNITVTAHRYDHVATLSKSTVTADLEVSRSSDGQQILLLQSWESERKHQRIHCHSTPRNASTGLTLYKKSFTPLISDSDSPEITGIDNALLAAVISDMQEGQRQYGKAASKMQEAVAMIGTMADLERHQSENATRLIFHGDGNEWGSESTLTSKEHFIP